MKKAYRKLARTNHPDANGGDDKRFKEIGEAYSVLSDAEQRKQYDAVRAMSGGGARFAPGGGGSGFEDVFSSMFGGAGAGGGTRFPPGGGAGGPGGIDLEDLLRTMGAGDTAGGRGRSRFGGFGAPRGPQRGADVEATTRLGFREAVTGSTVTLRSPDGSQVTARVPAGTRDGQRIRLRGKGGRGDQGGAAGDMLITVQVSPDPVFGRTGDDLTVTVPVTFAEAALGATVEVPVLEARRRPRERRHGAGQGAGRHAVRSHAARARARRAHDVRAGRPAGRRAGRGAAAARRRGARGRRVLRRRDEGEDPRAGLMSQARGE
nr:DnaJ C-terminal domain-containing protein [Angustibacter aerolatus]